MGDGVVFGRRCPSILLWFLMPLVSGVYNCLSATSRGTTVRVLFVGAAGSGTSDVSGEGSGAGLLRQPFFPLVFKHVRQSPHRSAFRGMLWSREARLARRGLSPEAAYLSAG